MKTPATSATADRGAVVAAAHRRGVRAATESLVAGSWLIGLWFWAIALLIGGIILFVMTRNDEVEMTAVGGPAESARFYLFVFGIIVPLTMIAVHVAAGGTRRSFTHALWLGGAVVGVTFGLAGAVLSGAAWWLGQRMGWGTGDMPDQLYDDASQFWLVLLVQAISCTVYFLAGMAVGLGYYRAGLWGGTGIALAALVPVAIAEVALRSGWFGGALARSVGLAELTVLVAVLGGLVAVVLAALLLRAVLRDVAVRPVDFSSNITTG